MPEQARMSRLLMNRRRFADLRVDESAGIPAPAEGEAVLAVDRFSLTVNNLTYATFGDELGYWRFFPVDESDGLLPVWGYADVAASRADGIEAGQRYFGFYPAASHLLVRPGKSGPRSFRDDAPHRRELPEIYNWYQRTDDDPAHAAATEPLHAIYRPLFVTAFCLADFLVENAFFGAERVVISSASSKTGYSTAFCIRQLSGIHLTGLTSAGNQAFVDRLGLYSDSLSYDDIERLDAGRPTLYIDIAGNGEVQARVHAHFGDRLVHDCAVGAAHTLEPPRPSADLPGPAPEFFFAPQWIARRHRDWGPVEFDRRAGEAAMAFFDYVQRHKLLAVTETHGLEGAREVLEAMLDGGVDPAVGHVVRLASTTRASGAA